MRRYWLPIQSERALGPILLLPECGILSLKHVIFELGALFHSRGAANGERSELARLEYQLTNTGLQVFNESEN